MTKRQHTLAGACMNCPYSLDCSATMFNTSAAACPAGHANNDFRARVGDYLGVRQERQRIEQAALFSRVSQHKPKTAEEHQCVNTQRWRPTTKAICKVFA